ncbi:hypothetical protein ACFODL_05155 [Phenylobacterium terrae]|uniref:N-acetyltransferase domain-containing protein n=1 Tax=Phenylobacterium terrae TaxID=2665495 RepID=A0ABW4MVB5_9CAUL
MSVAELEARAREGGWPEGLLARAAAVHTPTWLMDMWLASPAPKELLFADVERQVAVFEKLANSTLRAREITPRDEEAFSRLWATAPEKIGDWEIIVERAPNALAQFQLHEDPRVTIIEDRGEVVACTAWSSANLTVGGAKISIHYAMAMRVSAARRREGLGDIVRRFPSRSLGRPTVGQVMFMRVGNDNVEGFLKTVGFRAGATRPQKVVSVTHYAPAPLAWPQGARAARPEDAGACAELINRTHAGFDLFRPLGEESLALRLDGWTWGPRPDWAPRAYGWGDYFVLEREGRIVACAGLWDRGRDLRELWRNTVTGEQRTVSCTALLDFGCAAGCEADLAELIRGLIGRTAELGRTSLTAHLEPHAALAERLSDLEHRPEPRILEWSPYIPELPGELGEVSLDLRYW